MCWKIYFTKTLNVSLKGLRLIKEETNALLSLAKYYSCQLQIRPTKSDFLIQQLTKSNLCFDKWRESESVADSSLWNEPRNDSRGRNINKDSQSLNHSVNYHRNKESVLFQDRLPVDCDWHKRRDPVSEGTSCADVKLIDVITSHKQLVNLLKSCSHQN